MKCKQGTELKISSINCGSGGARRSRNRRKRPTEAPIRRPPPPPRLPRQCHRTLADEPTPVGTLPPAGLQAAGSVLQDLKDEPMLLDNQDAARRFCPLNPKRVLAAATGNRVTRRAKSGRPSQRKAGGSSGPSAGQKGDSGAGRKAPVRGSARIVVRRPRLLQQHFCRQQKPPKPPH